MGSGILLAAVNYLQSYHISDSLPSYTSYILDGIQSTNLLFRFVSFL